MTSDKPSDPTSIAQEGLEKGRMYYATASRLPCGRELVRANHCIYPVFIVQLHMDAERKQDVNQGVWWFMELRSSPEMEASGKRGETKPVKGWFRPTDALADEPQEVEITFLPTGIAEVTVSG